MDISKFRRVNEIFDFRDNIDFRDIEIIYEQM